MIGLSGFKSGEFIFIEIAEVCRHGAGLAVQLPPLTAVGVVCAVRYLAGERRLIAILKAYGDIVDFHHINEISRFRPVRFQGNVRGNVGGKGILFFTQIPSGKIIA